MDNLENRRVAILVENGFEEIEFTKPLEALKNAGADCVIISPQEGKVKAWDMKNWGNEYNVDMNLNDANAIDFDCLLLPGGVMNPDYLRVNDTAVDFVKHFFREGKPIAAICHGPWTLIETGAIKDRTLTSYPSIKTDLVNAGANWVDKEVVVDNGLITSRKPADLEVFCKKMVEEFAEGVHEEQNSLR